MHHPHSTYPHLFPPPLDPSLDGREPSASSAASSARSSSSSANLNAAPPPYSPPPHSHLDHVKMVPVHRQQSIPSHDPHAARPPHGGGPAPGQLAQLSPTRASSSKLALPPPPKPPYPRTDELARFEVMETLGQYSSLALWCSRSRARQFCSSGGVRVLGRPRRAHPRPSGCICGPAGQHAGSLSCSAVQSFLLLRPLRFFGLDRGRSCRALAYDDPLKVQGRSRGRNARGTRATSPPPPTLLADGRVTVARDDFR